jgi:hypothetical protein
MIPVQRTTPEGTMAAAELTTTDTEQAKIERWRAAELERAGYDPAAAALLAGRNDVDLHHAIDLLRNGCAPDLALQILL